VRARVLLLVKVSIWLDHRPDETRLPNKRSIQFRREDANAVGCKRPYCEPFRRQRRQIFEITLQLEYPQLARFFVHPYIPKWQKSTICRTIARIRSIFNEKAYM